MLNQDYTAKILDLEDVIITNVENVAGQLHIHLELPQKEHRCPACGTCTSNIHDYRNQVIKDVPLARNTYLHLRKRRYRCDCGKRFFEKNSFLPRYHRVTNRLVASVIQAFRKTVPAKDIGSQYNISGVTAMRYFNCFNTSPAELPEVLSIDEFKGNSGGQKYNSLVVDPKEKRVLDVLPNRFENDLSKYFSQFPSKNKVKCFVCDMNPHFRQVAERCFPQAIVVADKYHVIRQVFWAMENVRKNEQKKLSEAFRKYFKKSRSLLMKSINSLTDEERNKLALMFEIAPRLATAYRLKSDFMEVMHSSSSKEGEQKLADWLYAAEKENMPEFRACTTAYHNWAREILNSLDVPWTNGFIEGCNNKTKVLKRVCFGMRNFDNFRKRILFFNT